MSNEITIPTPFNELPLLKDLPVKTPLTITKAVSGKTEKNSYPCVTLTTLEKSDIFSIDSGVLYNLAKIGAGNDTKLPEDQKSAEFQKFLEKGCSVISPATPLKVVTGEYKSKRDGEMRATIKNRTD